MVNWPLQWYTITYEAVYGLWKGFLVFLPKALGAVVVFAIGWVFATGIGRLVTEILNKLKFNRAVEKTGWAEAFKKAELKVDLSNFLGAVVKWILVLTVLLAVVEILGFYQFAIFLTKVLGFLPNVLIAALIFVVATILADILQKVTVASIEKVQVGYARFAGMFVRWTIMMFAIMAILVQLGIAREMTLILFQGIVAFLVISLGLAFGLGGKDVAAEVLRELREKLR